MNRSTHQVEMIPCHTPACRQQGYSSKWSNLAFFAHFNGMAAANDYVLALRSPQSPLHRLAMNITLGDENLNFMLPVDEFYSQGALGTARVEYVCTENLAADFNRIAARWQLNITLLAAPTHSHTSTASLEPLHPANLAWVEATYAADFRLWKAHCNASKDRYAAERIF